MERGRNAHRQGVVQEVNLFLFIKSLFVQFQFDFEALKFEASVFSDQVKLELYHFSLSKRGKQMVATFEQVPVIRIVIRWSMYVEDEKKLRKLQEVIDAWKQGNKVFPISSSGGPEMCVELYTRDKGEAYVAFLRSLGILETDCNCT
jgi:hypothetical protein